MDLTVFTQSDSYRQYISGFPELEVTFKSAWEAPQQTVIHLVHCSSMEAGFADWMQRYVLNKGIIVAVLNDMPDVADMLNYTKLGARAYCNSYMRSIHYQQMLRLLQSGQSWFPPELVAQTFKLAHKVLHGNDIELRLSALTEREKQVALAVSESMTNKQIAERYNIKEPTVKTHLTNIFRKLQVQDRVGLVVYLKQG